jgi:hypothetical protein
MLTIEPPSIPLDRILADVEKQLRFAASLALTNTAKDAQGEVRRQLPQRFTIRTGWRQRRSGPGGKQTRPTGISEGVGLVHGAAGDGWQQDFPLR